jgi:hypothetical protein
MKTKTLAKTNLPASTSMMVVAESIKRKAQPIIKKVQDCIIKTKDEYDAAAKAISQLKELSREAERQEKTLTEPAKSIIKSAQEIFKPFRTQVSTLEVSIKSRMLEFQEHQEKKSAKLLEKFESGEIKKLSTIVTKQNELLTTSSENAQLRKVWTLFIENEKLIPRNYLVADEVKIRTAMKAGEKVAGCRWEQVNSIAI